MAASDHIIPDEQPSYLVQEDYRSIRAELKRYRAKFANCPPKASGSELYCRYCRLKDDHDSSKCPSVDIKSALKGYPAGGIALKPRPLRFNIKEHARENAIIIKDLPDDTCESDLVTKLKTFGPLRKVEVSKDKKTGMCEGFAFVSFQSIDDAERALNNFNGDGYETVWFRGI